MNEATEAAQSMPGGAWVLIGAFFVFLGYRVYKSKKETGTYLGGVIPGGGGGGKPPKQHH